MNRITLLISSFFIAALGLVASHIEAAEKCTFSKTLELGATSEEVRCLQRYLNGEGFIVADSGVGSPGQETNLYREKTKEAVRKWQQANSIFPATGNFGPLSQAKYKALVDAVTVPQIPSTPPPTPTPLPTPQPAPAPAVSDAEKNARTRIADVIEEIDELNDDIEDAESDSINTGDAEELVEEAQEKLWKAVKLFMKGDYEGSLGIAKTALKKAEDARDELDDHVDSDDDDDEDDEESEAEDAIDDAKDAIDEADKAIEEAQDDGDDTDDAEDLLEEAEDKLDEAEEALDDEEYDEAIDLAEEAQDLAEEAIDEL